MRLRVLKLVHGGWGLGRGTDGRVWLVPFTAPGDEVEVRPVRDRGRHVEGAMERLVTPGPGRTDPTCPVYGRCGGCQLQHLAYDRQVEVKAAVLAETLRRNKVEAPAPEVVAGEPYGWRARIELHVSSSRLGYFARGSHALVEPRACPIARPALSALIPWLREAIADARPAACEVEAIQSSDGHVVLVARCGALDARKLADRLAAVPGVAGAAAGGSHGWQLRGGVRVRWPTLGAGGAPVEVEQDARGFTQANAGLNRRMVATVLTLAGPRPADRVLELYAGAGNLTVPLAATGAEVTAVEVNAGAVEDAASALSGPRAVASPAREPRFLAGDVSTVAAGLVAGGERFHLVVADPPRTGLGPEVASAVSDAAAPGGRVVICSCEPSTLARDLAALAVRGWRVDRLVMVDMFPQTYHLEAVALLARRA